MNGYDESISDVIFVTFNTEAKSPVVHGLNLNAYVVNRGGNEYIYDAIGLVMY